MRDVPRSPWPLTAVTTPFFPQSREDGASQDVAAFFSCKLLRRSPSFMLNGCRFLILDKYFSLNTSLLMSANLFIPSVCLRPSFEFLSITHLKFFLKISNLLSVSSECLYTILCFSIHRWKNSLKTLSSDGSSSAVVEGSVGRHEQDKNQMNSLGTHFLNPPEFPLSSDTLPFLTTLHI